MRFAAPGLQAYVVYVDTDQLPACKYKFALQMEKTASNFVELATTSRSDVEFEFEH